MAALNLESRFDLETTRTCIVLNRATPAGIRSENRYLVFPCLQCTLDLPSDQRRVLGESHQKRNVAEYEGNTDIDVALLNALVVVVGGMIQNKNLVEAPLNYSWTCPARPDRMTESLVLQFQLTRIPSEYETVLC